MMMSAEAMLVFTKLSFKRTYRGSIRLQNLLTDADLAVLIDEVKRNFWACTLHSDCLGCHFVRFWAGPIYPGLPAECFGYLSEDELEARPRPENGYANADSWNPFAVLSPFTHNLRNEELQKLWNLEKNREASFYEY